MSNFWPIALLPKTDEESESKVVQQQIVQKNNMAIYAAALLTGDNVEGD